MSNFIVFWVSLLVVFSTFFVMLNFDINNLLNSETKSEWIINFIILSTFVFVFFYGFIRFIKKLKRKKA